MILSLSIPNYPLQQIWDQRYAEMDTLWMKFTRSSKMDKIPEFTPNKNFLVDVLDVLPFIQFYYSIDNNILDYVIARTPPLKYYSLFYSMYVLVYKRAFISLTCIEYDLICLFIVNNGWPY